MILFICGSIEPGKSGVGDYTLILARKIVSQTGIACSILALNDSHVNNVCNTKDIIDPRISVTRIPSTGKGFKQWKSITQSIIDQQAPTWISLQYVGYAYNRYGLASPITKLLKSLKTNSKLHIMFHELWEGFGVNDNFKSKLRGAVQKQSLKRLLKSQKPAACHTQNHFYLRQLKSLHLQADYLPLFGNIKVNSPNPSQAWEIVSKKSELLIDPKLRKDYIVFSFFGSIYPNWPKDVFVEEIKKLIQKCGKQIILLSLGKLGRTRVEWEWLRYNCPKRSQMRRTWFSE